MTPRDPLASLSATDRQVLAVLLEHKGRVTGRDSVMRLAMVESLTNRRVDVSIVALRRLLGPNSITTVRRRGWMLTDVGVAAAEKLLQVQVDRQS